MTLKEFKDHISQFPDGTVFPYGISEPFSWRGAYDEVAFSIMEIPTDKNDVLNRIQMAYSNIFYGYKGGKYRYNDWTTVNFEEGGSRDYTDGKYTAKMIAYIEKSEVYPDQEHRLVKVAFR